MSRSSVLAWLSLFRPWRPPGLAFASLPRSYPTRSERSFCRRHRGFLTPVWLFLSSLVCLSPRGVLEMVYKGGASGLDGEYGFAAATTHRMDGWIVWDLSLPLGETEKGACLVVWCDDERDLDWTGLEWITRATGARWQGSSSTSSGHSTMAPNPNTVPVASSYPPLHVSASFSLPFYLPFSLHLFLLPFLSSLLSLFCLSTLLFVFSSPESPILSFPIAGPLTMNG
ncbi:hypothetical protein N658DRAFT_192631 [Parathielavia hyrcaniae]|uniref:Uncharacterized protein n=1 Tax=Parathielavia hyrcaniae TaxID=113614 RepID=A0AAN6Q7D3_9PEZI|nr:hypothetical protein N658DRAFT_192631 [Parathielavia hyrcaniae]